MEELLLIIIFFLFGFISSIDIDIKGVTGTYSLTSGETYNFYVPVKQMIQIYVDFRFINFTYGSFSCIHINEYSSRNGTSLRHYTIKDIEYYKDRVGCGYFFYYDLENFSTTYISFSFESNSTVDIMDIEIIIEGGLYYLSNGVSEDFNDVYYDVPFYFVIPVRNSKINVELNTSNDENLDDLNLTLIEYQKNNSDYYIYERRDKNYTIYEDDENKTISFNYVIKNDNTNFFCLKFSSPNNAFNYLKVTFKEERYYYTLYDKNSLNIFDLKPNQTYHISIEAKKNNLFSINYAISTQDNNNLALPLESMIIYEDKSEFSPDHLSKVIHNIKVSIESFSYFVTESETKYLSLKIEPLFTIKKFSFKYNIKKGEIFEYNLKNNTLLSMTELYPYFTYKFNINSKILEKLEYEITIKYSDIRPLDNISLIENPSGTPIEEQLSFKKVGNYLKASSSFINTYCDTKNSTFLIKFRNYNDYFSIKVKVIEANLYYLNKEVNKNIQLLLAKKEYYFAINIDRTLSNVLIYINIKYKSNIYHSFIDLIDYYTESKYKFKLSGLPLRLDYNRNGNEYNATSELDFTSQFYPHLNFDVLLLKIVSIYNFDDFNIEYKYVNKVNNTPTEKKSNTWVYIVCPIGAVLAIVSLGTSAKFGCKKKSNSNLIEDNIDADANLMPQENQEKQENKDENK